MNGILQRGFAAIALTCAVGGCDVDCAPGLAMTAAGCVVPGGGGGGGGHGSSRQPASNVQPGPAGRSALPVRVGAAGMVAGAQALPTRTEPDDDAGVPSSSEPPRGYRPECGNGVTEAGELCDGAWCAQCRDSGNACLVGAVRGDAARCTAVCEMAEVAECKAGDGCCPSSCTHATDSDCSAKCGDGNVDEGETCDPKHASGCPESCDDGDPCTVDMLTGSAKACSVMCGHVPARAGRVADSCCPVGANAAIDPDCATECGDGVITGDETCDPGAPNAHCPADCGDGDPCTADAMAGDPAACTARCMHSPVSALKGGDQCCPKGGTAVTDSDCAAVCGNGVVEPGEACDGKCPASCDDGNACTADSMSGTGMECSTMCSHTPIVDARSGDGCCPDGANANTDRDCKPVCGNGVHEGSETCDGDCPNCDDGDPCTSDSATGSADACSVVCSHTPVGQACCRTDADCGGLNRTECVADTTSCDATVTRGLCRMNQCLGQRVTEPNGCTARRVTCGPEYRTGATGACPTGCGCTAASDCAAGYTCDHGTARCVQG